MPQLEFASDQPALQARTERIVMLVLAAVQFISIVDFMVVMPLGPELMQTLGIGPAGFGLIVSSYTFAASIAGLITSAIVDRYSRRAAFQTLLTGFLIGTFLCGLAPSYPFLLAARVVTGAFGGILGGMSMAIIGDVFPEERRGQATASLMLGFALATIVGVPAGLSLGTAFGWHVPFICLAVLGLPILVVSFFALPPLNEHLGKEHAHPLRSLIDTFTIPGNLNSFALISSIMIGAFTVVPYISDYLEENVGVTKTQLPLVFLVSGIFSLVGALIIGKLADRYGKLAVFRAIIPISALMLVVVTNLPPVHVAVAVLAVATLMLCNVGRMIAAMAMITSSVQRERRGSFLSAIASAQHLATGIGACVGGLLIKELPDHRLQRYGVVGWLAAAITLASVWFAGRVRIVDDAPITETSSLAAAAEATCDVGEPLVEV